MRAPGVVVAVLLTLACSRHRPAQPIRIEPDRSGKTDVAATQERIAQAFYRTIIPHLKACWPDVKDGGEIELKLTYRSKEGIASAQRNFNDPRLPICRRACDHSHFHWWDHQVAAFQRADGPRFDGCDQEADEL